MAGRIMLALDLIPRICMSLMLTVSALLAETVGIPHPAWQMTAVLLLGPVWLALVLFLHLREAVRPHRLCGGSSSRCGGS